MGKLNINNGGIDTNKVMPDIDERFGPYASIEAANTALGVSGRDCITAGLTVGITQNDGNVKEYWYQPQGSGLALVPKQRLIGTHVAGDFASFDANGYVVDSGHKHSDYATSQQGAKADAAYKKPIGGIPATDLESSVQTSLGKADTAVQEVTVGKTTTGAAGTNASVTNRGTATNPVLDFTIPRGADGQDGADAVNPFKGWHDTTETFPANPHVGDYAYLNDNGTTYIYRCATDGEWPATSTEEASPENATFASSQSVSNVKIDETALRDYNTADNTNNPVVAKASDALQLRHKLDGIEAREYKVELIEDTNAERGKYVSGQTGQLAVPSTSVNSYGYFETEIMFNTKCIRFLAGNRPSSSYKLGYALGYYDGNDDFVPLRSKYFEISNTPKTAEIVINVEPGETVFRTTCLIPSSASLITFGNFYCYMQIGDTVKDVLDTKLASALVDDLVYPQKNLIDVNSDEILTGGVFTADGWTTSSANYGVESNKLRLREGFTYSVQNVSVYVGSDYVLAYMSRFDAENNFLGLTTIPATNTTPDVTSTNRQYGKATFTYEKEYVDEAYVRIRLRRLSSTDQWEQAQLEVGDSCTDVVGYNAVYVKDIAKKSELDADVAAINSKFLYNSRSKMTAGDKWKGYISFTKPSGSSLTPSASNDYLFRYIGKETIQSYATRFYAYDPTKQYYATVRKMPSYGFYELVYLGGEIVNGEYTGTFGTISNDVYTAAPGMFLGRKFKDVNKDGEELTDIPEGTKTIALCYHVSSDSNVYLEEASQEEISLSDLVDNFNNIEKEAATQRKLCILAIGNSYTEDSFAYLPYIFREIVPEVDIELHLMMQSSSSLAQHVENFLHAKKNMEDIAAGYEPTYPHELVSGYSYWYQDGRSCYYYSYNSTDGVWVKRYNDDYSSYLWTIQQVMDGCVPDIIALNVTMYEDSLNHNFQILVNLLASYSIKPFKTCAVMTGNGMKKTSTTAYPEGTVFDEYGNFETDDDAEDTNANHVRSSIRHLEKVMDKTVCEAMIPVNTAINNAFTVEELKSIGSYASKNTSGFGYLRYGGAGADVDGKHLQEGLPRQLAAYTTLQSILGLIGYGNRSVVGDKTCIDDLTDLYSPDQKGDPTGWEANKEVRLLIIQECAVMACKHPYVVTDMTPFLETEEESEEDDN